MASYEYSAYGKIRNLQSLTTIGAVNPIRYKGYYYDTETGLYYLQSRYYNPSWGRFISADDISYIDESSITGLNLFAYCNNDPVNYCDPSGHSAILIGLLIGTALLFTPIGGTIAQAVTSVGCYVGIAISSIWDENVRNDMDAIG